MNKTVKKEIKAYGIKVLLSRHPSIRRLKRINIPSLHGNKFWTSSWLLMDYFKKNGLKKGSRVMELGCGWGLAGIYCAKNYGALVTGIDADPDVFPFLQLHCDVNNVSIKTMEKNFDSLTVAALSRTDVLIGADICFWDNMFDQLRRLIQRALRGGTKLILISDPVRSPFEELGKYCVQKFGGEVLDWEVKQPRPILGQILKISSNNYKRR